MIGKLKTWKFDKGYGFITGEDGVDYYTHISNLEFDSIPLEKSVDVSFEVYAKENKVKAIKVNLLKKGGE